MVKLDKSGNMQFNSLKVIFDSLSGAGQIDIQVAITIEGQPYFLNAPAKDVGNFHFELTEQFGIKSEPSISLGTIRAVFRSRFVSHLALDIKNQYLQFYSLNGSCLFNCFGLIVPMLESRFVILEINPLTFEGKPVVIEYHYRR